MNHRIPLILVLALVSWGNALAHPAHVSIAELEWDAAVRSFEVSLRMAPEELELALSRSIGRSVSLLGTEALDDLLRELVTARFTIKLESGQALAPNWIGHETSPRAAWLYFEFRPGPRQKTFVLSNRLLLGIRAQQVNTVNLKIGKQRQTFRFSRDNVEAKLVLPDAEGSD